MNRWCLSVLLATVSSTSLFAQPPSPRPPRRERVVVIDSVNVIDIAAARVVPLQRIVVRGDSIVLVQSVTAPAPDSVDVRISGAGTFAMPGLVDHHVHLSPGMQRSLAQAARGGVTMVQAMAGDNRTAGELARAVIAKELAGPEIAYASVMAGPDFFVDPRFSGSGIGFPLGKAPWAQAVTAQTDVVRAVAAARGSGAEVLKLYAMIDSALAARLTAEAHTQGMRVVAHGAVFPARPLQLAQSGVDVLTHMPYLSWQGAPTLKPTDSWERRNGPYSTVPADGPVMMSLLRAIKAAGTAVEPTLFVFARQANDVQLNTWASTLTGKARELGIPIIAGTDGLIGQDSTALPNVHTELQLLVKAGLSPAQALASATTVPARIMGRERTHGVIAAGRVADIVLLTANPLDDVSNTTRIRQVVLRGRPLPR